MATRSAALVNEQAPANTPHKATENDDRPINDLVPKHSFQQWRTSEPSGDNQRSPLWIR